MKDRIRLDKFISACVPCSRKEAQQFLRAGSVCVNGSVCRSGDVKAGGDDTVTLSGRRLVYHRCVYYMLNKPAGVVSATVDPHDRTVIDLIPPRLQREGIFPAGRLDKDTTGLLILTDDGDYAHRMISPKKHVKKRYIARVDKMPDPDAPARFAQGIVLHDGTVCLPAELEILDDNTAAVTLCEGRFHQVKRMLHEVGCVTLALKRVQIGALELDEGLAPGEMRQMTEDEIGLSLR